jgi:endonuclease-3
MREKSAKRLTKAAASRPVKAAGKTFAETPEERRKRAAVIREILGKEFPEARTALLHHSPFQLLVATILSAQCTDERVNMVTPVLFGRYQTPSEFASADQTELESIIRSTGFFRMKAKNIIGCSKGLVERFGGEVPSRMEDLVTLPGVGRKTANVVLGQAFGIASGVVVDTHVHRLAQRMGFSREKTPEKIEADLMDAFPQSSWIEISSSIILHGRRTCPARKPKCDVCVVAAYCPKL